MAVKIVKNEEQPESTEILAASIITIANGFEKLLSGPLNDDAIIALLYHKMKGRINKTDIELVLSNLRTLKGYYLRK